MNMARNVQIPPPTRLMQLHKPVPAHGMLLRPPVPTVLRTRHLAAVHKRVRGNMIPRPQLVPQGRGQLGERGAGVGELGRAARAAGGGQGGGAEQRGAGAARVEARVGVEQGVAPVHGVAVRVGARDGAVRLEVRHVEELRRRQPVRLAQRRVGPHVVQLAEARGEGDVAVVV